MVVTRFNPGSNGSLHLGHLYSLLVNERFAHGRRGKFCVRFDDTSQAIRIEMEHPERIDQIIQNQIDEIAWLGIQVDAWQRQSDVLDEVHTELKKHKLYGLGDIHPHYLPVSIRFGSSWIPYPYTANQTAERVIMDKMLGITHVIRGDEFLTEYSLYYFFAEQMNVKMPEFIFLPRLVSSSGDISKTNGGYKISEFRANGYTPEELIHMMEWACLYWWKRGWSLENLKPNPKIEL